MPAPAFSKPKTFYFGMDNSLAKESEDCVNLGNDRIQARLDADNPMTDQDEVSKFIFFFVFFTRKHNIGFIDSKKKFQ